MSICSVTLSLGCLTKADLVLLIDSSSSVGQEDFQHLEDFVKDLVVQLPIGQDQVSPAKGRDQETSMAFVVRNNCHVTAYTQKDYTV